jgi:hypothetical protein
VNIGFPCYNELVKEMNVYVVKNAGHRVP